MYSYLYIHIYKLKTMTTYYVQIYLLSYQIVRLNKNNLKGLSLEG